jgi:hypothetical protein
LPPTPKGDTMNDGYVELILSRIAAVAAQQDRQTGQLNELQRDVAALLVRIKSIDKRLEKIENRAAR